MPFNLNTFQAQINKTGGVALSHNFDIIIPSVVGKDRQSLLDEDVALNMTFRADSIAFPGRGILPMDYRTYGPPMKIGSLANYVDIDMNIILSPDLRERKFFMKWQDIIVGRHRNNTLNGDQQRHSFDVGYYNDYISEGITIRAYIETRDTPIYQLKLIDAYPIRVGDLQVNWSQTEIMKLPITLSYRYFIDESMSLF